jgi:hypothetical protein
MEVRKSYAAGLVGVAVTLTLWLLSRTPRNTPSLTVFLLVVIFVLFALSIYFMDFIRDASPEKKRISRFLLTLCCLAVVMVWFGIQVWPSPQPLPRQEAITILTKYTMGQLPILVPPKSTVYILQMNPKISDGTYEASNDGPTDIWWPEKPPKKNEAPLGFMYACQFTNNGDKTLFDLEVSFFLRFYSVEEGKARVKKNKDGTTSLTTDLPNRYLPGISGGGARREAAAEYWHGKVTAITPGVPVGQLHHRATILSIDPHSTASIYLVNQSRLFVQFDLPTAATTMVDGQLGAQPAYLIRPALNPIEKIPDFFMQPSTYPWKGVPDYP